MKDIDLKKKEIVAFFMEKGILVTSDLLESLSNSENVEGIYDLIKKNSSSDMLVLNNDIKEIICKKDSKDIMCREFEKCMAMAQKNKDVGRYQNFINVLDEDAKPTIGTEQTSTENREETKEQVTEKKEGEESSESIFADGEKEEGKKEENKERRKDENKEEQKENSDSENTNVPLPEGEKPEGTVKIIHNYKENVKKREVQDFVDYFNARHEAIEQILRQRGELQSIMSIGRVVAKKDRDNVSVIGIVSSKALTKNENIMLTIEDNTGSIKVLINKNKPEIYNEAKDIVLDEVLAIVGVNGDNIIFANQVIWPDVPVREYKKAKDDAHAIFLSDIHVGSDTFLEEEFEKFIDWISGESGNEQQRELAKKVKYIFIIGDLVDGVGIYPGQDSELIIKDIYKQYERCAEFLKKIPSRIHIIICPGNHDAMRIAEPQPELYKDFTQPIWDLPNVTMVTNPSTVNIHSSEEFSGFDVLLYHGYSFDYYIANVDSVRNGGGYDSIDVLMKYLLKRRHLAPTHASTLYIPDKDKDNLVIETLPDFFITGHVHKTAVSNYKGITLICGSCWQDITSFQKKVGHNPEPGRVPMVDLKTRNVRVLRFK